MCVCFASSVVSIRIHHIHPPSTQSSSWQESTVTTWRPSFLGIHMNSSKWDLPGITKRVSALWPQLSGGNPGKRFKIQNLATPDTALDTQIETKNTTVTELNTWQDFESLTRGPRFKLISGNLPEMFCLSSFLKSLRISSPPRQILRHWDSKCSGRQSPMETTWSAGVLSDKDSIRGGQDAQISSNTAGPRAVGSKRPCLLSNRYLLIPPFLLTLLAQTWRIPGTLQSLAGSLWHLKPRKPHLKRFSHTTYAKQVWLHNVVRKVFCIAGQSDYSWISKHPLQELFVLQNTISTWVQNPSGQNQQDSHHSTQCLHWEKACKGKRITWDHCVIESPTYLLGGTRR